MQYRRGYRLGLFKKSLRSTLCDRALCAQGALFPGEHMCPKTLIHAHGAGRRRRAEGTGGAPSVTEPLSSTWKYRIWTRQQLSGAHPIRPIAVSATCPSATEPLSSRWKPRNHLRRSIKSHFLKILSTSGDRYQPNSSRNDTKSPTTIPETALEGLCVDREGLAQICPTLQSHTLAPYSRAMPRPLWWSWVVSVFL